MCIIIHMSNCCYGNSMIFNLFIEYSFVKVDQNGVIYKMPKIHVYTQN